MNSTNLSRFENDGVELYIDTGTGESFTTQAGYARMSGKTQQTISSRITKLKKSQSNPPAVVKGLVKTTAGLQKANLIDINIVLQWLVKDNINQVNTVVDFIKKVTKKSPELPSFPTAKKKKYKNPEKVVQTKLANKLNGITEVPCKTGKADILTETEIIEVKKAKEWKYAIGQVLIYHLEYPDRQARIHLYEECSEEFKQMVVSFALRLNVIATFED